jgi:hypothetical protein
VNAIPGVNMIRPATDADATPVKRLTWPDDDLKPADLLLLPDDDDGCDEPTEEVVVVASPRMAVWSDRIPRA